MSLRCRRHHRVAAALGLLAGMALLLGLVLDGGMASPTRADGPEGSAAVPHSEVPAVSAQAREDHPAWGASLLSSRIALLAAGILALALTPVLVPPSVVAGPVHRAPAVRAARHRGPPALV